MKKIQALLIGVALALSTAAASAQNAPDLIAPTGIGAKLNMNQVRALPDSAVVQLSNGRKVSAGRIKKLASAIEKIKQNNLTSAQPSSAFARPTASAAVQLRGGVNLREISKRPDGDILQLPDGRKITVGDLKKLSEVHRQRTGQALLDIQPKGGGRPSTEGAATRINSRADLQKLTDKPDSTILESRSGKRITLGELRAYAKKNNKPLGARK